MTIPSRTTWTALLRLLTLTVLFALGWLASGAALAGQAVPAVASTEHAADAEIRVLELHNPKRSTGIQIGDYLERRLQVEIAQPYQLAISALPLKGTNRHGIELADVRLEKTSVSASTIYTLLLRYQVFAASTSPAILQLPAERIALNGGPRALVLEVPAWHFWFSPLAAGTVGLAKTNLQPQVPPALISLSKHYQRLALGLLCLLAGLTGLVYVHADRRWLPFMGGAFAQAYRHIRRLPPTQQHEAQALLHLHQAFDRVHGVSLFAAGVDDFVAAHPQFLSLREDIAAFYAQSSQRLFTGQAGDAHFIDGLLTLARRLRHCERRLA
ncbi:nonribosomal peptide synthetase MxaA [Pseudomethylobacillus aquaticus]|uniref:nonribosomal peptide synthetase MxaA n=1 Tax=Pseudomethylobacillus aquaticus TaxID=2676064 RepID=UPI001EFFD541|nr:nonribosomal peptide synthetase MxaA [Pseudomethylobacillus aquaticus]